MGFWDNGSKLLSLDTQLQGKKRILYTDFCIAAFLKTTHGRTPETRPSVHNLLRVVLEHRPRIGRRALVRHELYIAVTAALSDVTPPVVQSHPVDDQRA